MDARLAFGSRVKFDAITFSIATGQDYAVAAHDDIVEMCIARPNFCFREISRDPEVLKICDPSYEADPFNNGRKAEQAQHAVNLKRPKQGVTGSVIVPHTAFDADGYLPDVARESTHALFSREIQDQYAPMLMPRPVH